MKTFSTSRFGWLALALGLALPMGGWAQFPGFGGPGGGGPGGGPPGGSSRSRSSSSSSGGNSAAMAAQKRVVAVADERSNSVIITAPEAMLEAIEEVLRELDMNVDDVTEVRVFALKNADPTEMSDTLNQLFGTTTSSSRGGTSSQGGFQTPFFFGGRFGGSSGGQGGDNRALRSDQKVLAVADPRTTSLIVSAPRQMMDQIAKMVEQLDASPAKKQKVFVYPLEFADVNKMSEILRGMFEGDSTRNRSLQTTSQDNALSTRSGAFGSAGSTSATTSNSGARGGTGGSATRGR